MTYTLRWRNIWNNSIINDSDVRGLIDKSDGATSSFNEFYGLHLIPHMLVEQVELQTPLETSSFTTSIHLEHFVFHQQVNWHSSNTVDYIIIAGGGAGGE